MNLNHPEDRDLLCMGIARKEPEHLHGGVCKRRDNWKGAVANCATAILQAYIVFDKSLHKERWEKTHRGCGVSLFAPRTI